jgi:hypothetical protein
MSELTHFHLYLIERPFRLQRGELMSIRLAQCYLLFNFATIDLHI